MKKDKKILLLSAADRRFVDKDEQILEEKYDVTRKNVYEYDFRRNPLKLLYLFLDVWTHDLIFGWFIHPITSVATIIGAIAGTPCILVAGGYDVAKVPEINYGQALNSKINILTRLAMNMSETVIAVSDNTKAEAQHICPKKDIKTIYVGAIDTEKFNSDNNKKENLIITTGSITQSTLYRKGLLPFAQTSAIDDDNEYIIIGKKIDQTAVDRLRNAGGENLTITGYVSDNRLLHYYKEANIYVQVSKHEGFGVALAEAMSCRCTPVVSRNGALPEVVGNTGRYVDEISPEMTRNEIIKAKSIDGSEARDRIIKKFHKSYRRQKLLKELSKYL
jgi:glycosyltransferase involved in cell wall biosynthesis